ncbi:response regulator [Bacteriovoracales bacterium]|nr:response regulator [Bacteriovoracales bacterium]
MELDPDLKVLVVDDMLAMRTIIEKGLKDLGFLNVTHATDGLTAFKLIQKAIEEEQPFEFIISDWNMPMMGGLDLLLKVRQLETNKDVPFLMITAEAHPKNEDKAIKAGVSNFIVKPFTKQIFKEKIDSIFLKKELDAS